MPILLPTANPGDWQRFLADPGHWKTGYSARSLAHCWHGGAGFPPEIRQALQSAEALADTELLLAIPEHRVPLPGGGKASQTDLWVLARASSGLVSIAVEGKVAESFGPTVGEWRTNASPGKEARLAFLRELLQLPEPVPDAIRYQLLHRAASALIEARRFFAPHAVMLVHSFSQSDEWYDDFAAFAQLLGTAAVKGGLAPVRGRTSPSLHLGWVRGEERWLSA